MPSAPPALFDATVVGPAEDSTERLRNRLEDNLRAQGIGERVLQALRAIRRHDYVTGYQHYYPPARTPGTLRGWLIGLYGCEPLTLTPPAGGTHRITSSMPTVAAMLDLLDVTAQHQVLEIGTGTGYTAALLHQLTGGTPVFTVEDDPGWRDYARATLGKKAHIAEPDQVPVRFTAADGGDYGADRVIYWQDMAETPPAWGRLLALEPPPTFGPRPERVVVTVVAGIITKLVFAKGALRGTFHRITDPSPTRRPIDALAFGEPRQGYPFLPDHLDVADFRLLLQLVLLGPRSPAHAEPENTPSESAGTGKRPFWTVITELGRWWVEQNRPDFSQLTLDYRDGAQVLTYRWPELHRRPAVVPDLATVHAAPAPSPDTPGIHHAL